MTTTLDDDTTLREAFAARTGRAPEDPEGCPAPERIYAAARGELPPGEVRDVVEHLAACPECAEAWRLAVALEEEAEEVGAGEGAFRPAAHPSPGRPWYLQPLRVAATVALAVVAVGVVWTVLQAPEEEPVYRAAGEPEITSLLPEGEPLPREEAVLRWGLVSGRAPEEDPEGTTYDLLVSTEALEPVAEADALEEARYRLPPEALKELPVGAHLLWRVEAHLADGRTVRSPTFTTAIE